MHEKSDIALKSPQTFSYFHAKKEEHSRAVFFFKVHTLHKHPHNVTAQKRKSFKKIRNKKPTKKNPRVSPLTT